MRGLVLEIGAGSGASLEYYSPEAYVVATEIDLSRIQTLADKARSRGVKARVLPVAADALRLPFAGASFDGLACNLALCTISDPLLALKEIQRVLKPGAPVRLLEHVRSEGALRARLQDTLAPLWGRMAGGCRLNQDTERLVRESGLVVEQVELRNGLLLPMKLIWARSPGA
jgi:ubiquinone/menaquinone biosynthesis C-methylase UbiE